MNKDWSRLDNAAKIFPTAMKGADSQVFRFSCETTNEIDPVFLQNALDETIEVFDVYRYVMKRGLFWYYLEKTAIKPVVRQEYKPPCAGIYRVDKPRLLFEVTYFNNRVNLEVYHVLSDGTGAMQFLRYLIIVYMCKKYGVCGVAPSFDASRTQMKDDSFARYYSKQKRLIKQKFRTAYQLKGSKISEDRLIIITGRMSVNSVLNIAKSKGVTLTTFLCACLMEAIGEEMTSRAKKKDVCLSVPVNLRKFFPSESARNFFSLIFTRYNFSKQDSSFESIMQKISGDLKDNLTPEMLSGNINAFSAVEHNFIAKILPLHFKDLCLKYAYRVSMLQSTATISNLGIVSMPPEIQDRISGFDVFAGTNKLHICLCSYMDTLSINLTSPFVNTDIQRRFFRKLTAHGIDIDVFSNLTGDDF